ncbi:MAG: dihydrolipoamide acetyltransferase family protein [Flavobacteriales bacterium]
MGKLEVQLPKMGESVNEATITKWLVEEGTQVEEDDAIMEIATDKVDSEVPAPADGIIAEKRCAEGDVVQVGEVIAVLQTEGAEEESEETGPAPQEEAVGAPDSSIADSGNGTDGKGGMAETSGGASSAPVLEGAEASPTEIPRKGPSGRFYSPLVRNIAKTEGIPLEELEQIEGSGKEGRVTKHDILSYLPQRKKEGAPAQASPAAPASPSKSEGTAPSKPSEPTAPEVPVGEDDEVVDMDRSRKLIAEHMVMSKRTSPHVTSFVEADVTNLVAWREKVKKKFEEREGTKLTFTPIFVEVLCKVIKEFPTVNVSLSGDKIIKRGHINIGMATAQENGNLIVPVIKDADQLNLVGLAQKVNDLADRARRNKLQPDETQGGTYTLSNVGSFGNLMGTPIINQPQVAVMAVGSIEKRPSVIETPHGDSIGVRHKMYLSHSYDHRIVDGALGGMFVKRVADLLEGFDSERDI